MGWTDERVAALKKLWLEGLSASQIANQLGGVTRNAVIGKIHRLGLMGRATPSQPARTVLKAPRVPRPVSQSPAAPRKIAAQGPVVLATVPRPKFRAEEPGSATILTLGTHMCKWPIGDPATENFTFCGRRASDGAPYCIEHAGISYQPRATRKNHGPNELMRSLRRYI